MAKPTLKSKILIYSVIVIAVAILLIMIFSGLKMQTEKNKGPCFNLSADEENLCWALENSTLAFCDNIIASAKRYQCYGAVAEKTNNPNICSQITSREMSYTCFNQMAMLRKDSGICASNIDDPYWKAQCYIYVALKYKDDSICAEMDNQYYRNQCFNSVTAAKG